MSLQILKRKTISERQIADLIDIDKRFIEQQNPFQFIQLNKFYFDWKWKMVKWVGKINDFIFTVYLIFFLAIPNWCFLCNTNKIAIRESIKITLILCCLYINIYMYLSIREYRGILNLHERTSRTKINGFNSQRKECQW